jgi:MFS family permease
MSSPAAVLPAGRATAWRSLLAGATVVAAGAMPGFLIASLAPRIRDDFRFGPGSLGLAIALFYVACAVLSTPAGHLVERVGLVRGLRLGGANTLICCLGVALLAHSAAQLTSLLLVGAAGNALSGPAVSALLGRDVPPAKQGLAFGAQQAGAPGASLLAGLMLPAIAIPLGWRWAFVATGGLAVGAALIAARGRGPAERARRTEVTPGSRVAAVRLLGVGAVFASFAGVGMISFLVVYALHSGMAESAAGLLLAGVSVGAASSRILTGRLADRSGIDPRKLVAGMMTVSAGGFLILLAGTPALVAVGALIAGSIGWAWPASLTLAVVRHSPDAPAWAVGVLMAGLFAGAVLGPLTVGLLAGGRHYAIAWTACAGAALLAAGTVLLPAARGSGTGPQRRAASLG